MYVQVNQLRVYTQPLTGAGDPGCSQMWLASGRQCLHLNLWGFSGSWEQWKHGGEGVCDSVLHSPRKAQVLLVLIIIHFFAWQKAQHLIQSVPFNVLKYRWWCRRMFVAILDMTQLHYISCFSVAVLKHQDQRQAMEDRFILAYGYRESVMVGEWKHQAAGMVGRAGSWESTSSISNTKHFEQHGSWARL